MSKHELKTDPDQWEDVASCKKNFDVRLNDRNYQVGDELNLRKTKHSAEDMRLHDLPLIFEKYPLWVRVTYVMHGPKYGLKEGWVIMGIRKI